MCIYRRSLLLHCMAQCMHSTAQLLYCKIVYGLLWFKADQTLENAIDQLFSVGVGTFGDYLLCEAQDATISRYIFKPFYWINCNLIHFGWVYVWNGQLLLRRWPIKWLVFPYWLLKLWCKWFFVAQKDVRVFFFLYFVGSHRWKGNIYIHSHKWNCGVETCNYFIRH